jgi:hypothetical protein
MATVTRSRRRQRRYAVTDQKTTCLEFELPGRPGRPVRLPVTNLSASGVSFSLDDVAELGGLEEGTSVPGAVVRIGECIVRGDLLIMHVSPDARGGSICGALLYPATETDLVKLKGVIAGMAAVTAD